MSYISVHTTQNVKLEYEVASVGERVLATLLDQLIFLGWFTLVTGIVTQLDINMGLTVGLIISVPVLLYHLLCEVFFNGQSIGKKTMKIKVLKTDGTPATLGDYMLRWLFRLIDCGISSGSVAILCILINGKGQRLGDLAAGTTVIRIRRSTTVEDISFAESDENYKVSYPEVMSLSDRDITVIRKILRKADRTGSPEMLQPLSEKLGTVLGISPGEDRRRFLETILKDYKYLAERSSSPRL